VGVAGSSPVVRSRETAGQDRCEPVFLLVRDRGKCQGSRRGPVSYTTSSRDRAAGGGAPRSDLTDSPDVGSERADARQVDHSEFKPLGGT
jgi:hypothetical protein